MTAMDRVFISYRRSTDQQSTDDLYDFLKRRTAGVFVDRTGIRGGHDFRHVIGAKIITCDVMLVVIGPNWLAAFDEPRDEDHVLFEISHASEWRKLVIPVLVGGARMPTRDELPPVICDLERRQAHRLADETWEQDCTALVRDVIGPELRRQVWRRWWRSRWMFAAVALMLVGGAIVYHYVLGLGYGLGESLAAALVIAVLIGGPLPLLEHLLRTMRRTLDRALLGRRVSDSEQLDVMWSVLGVSSLVSWMLVYFAFLELQQRPPDEPFTIVVEPLASGLDRSDFDPRECGDGEFDPGEECDFGDANGTGQSGGCTAQCTLPWTDVPSGSYSLLSRSGTVTLESGFRILTTEVTNAQFKRFGDPDLLTPRAAGCGGCSVGGVQPHWPKVSTSWEDAKAWCGMIRAKLPSEVQWEIAALGGGPGIFACGNEARCLYEHGVFDETCLLDAPMPEDVGSRTSNPIGLYDAFGNVSEWALDCYNQLAWRNVAKEDQVVAKAECSGRVVLGGSFRDSEVERHVEHSRTLRRPALPRGSDHVGFRCVRAISP